MRRAQVVDHGAVRSAVAVSGRHPAHHVAGLAVSRRAEPVRRLDEHGRELVDAAHGDAHLGGGRAAAQVRGADGERVRLLGLVVERGGRGDGAGGRVHLEPAAAVPERVVEPAVAAAVGVVGVRREHQLAGGRVLLGECVVDGLREARRVVVLVTDADVHGGQRGERPRAVAVGGAHHQPVLGQPVEVEPLPQPHHARVAVQRERLLLVARGDVVDDGRDLAGVPVGGEHLQHGGAHLRRREGSDLFCRDLFRRGRD